MIWRSHRRADRSARGAGESADRTGWCNSESGPVAPPDETPRVSSHQGDSGGESDKLAHDMIFDRLSPALKAPQQAALRHVLTDLSGPAEPGDLTVEAAVLASFRSRVPPAAAAAAPVPRTPVWQRFAPHSTRLAAGLVAAAIVAGGTAAAYAGALPGPLQDFAHQVIGAPAARHPSGHHPGGGPHLRPGATPAGATSPGRVPHSAAAGSAHAHPQPGGSAHSSRSAHPAQPRPSANSSPHPGRSSHPVPPQTSQPAGGSHPPQQGRSSRASQPAQPTHGPQQSAPPHASGPLPGGPATAPSQAAGPGTHSQPSRPAGAIGRHVPGPRLRDTRPGS